MLSEGNELGVAVHETEDADGNKTTTTRGTAAFDLDGVASDVQVQITNASGQVIDTLQLGAANPVQSLYLGWLQLRRGCEQFAVQSGGHQWARHRAQFMALALQAVVATIFTHQGMVLELANGKKHRLQQR